VWSAQVIYIKGFLRLFCMLRTDGQGIMVVYFSLRILYQNNSKLRFKERNTRIGG